MTPASPYDAGVTATPPVTPPGAPYDAGRGMPRPDPASLTEALRDAARRRREHTDGDQCPRPAPQAGQVIGYAVILGTSPGSGLARTTVMGRDAAEREARAHRPGARAVEIRWTRPQSHSGADEEAAENGAATRAGEDI